MTVLFADIAMFTQMSSMVAPQSVVAFLNQQLFYRCAATDRFRFVVLNLVDCRPYALLKTRWCMPGWSLVA